MYPYIAAATGRKRSVQSALDPALVVGNVANSIRTLDRRPRASRRGGGLASYLTTFVLGSIAQGAPFVVVAAALERRDVETGWLAAVAAVRLAPYLVCSPVAGALAGRYQARTVFAATSLARCALVVALWIALGVSSPASVLVALLFALVAFGTPTFPALMRAVHHTAGRERLDRRSAVAAGLESAAFCAGPALGGLLLLFTDATSALLVCAAMMAVAAGVATSLPTTGTTDRPIGGRSSRPVRSAGRCLLGPGIRKGIVTVLGVNLIAGLDAALLVRLPAELDLGGERAFGLLSFVHGVGAFAAFVTLLGPFRPGSRPLLPLATAGAAIGMLSVTSDLYIAAVACVALGASILTAEVLVTAALGRSVPGALVAPAFGLLDALMVAAMIGGAAVAPVLTAVFGLRPTLAIAGIGTPLLAICALQSRLDRARR